MPKTLTKIKYPRATMVLLKHLKKYLYYACCLFYSTSSVTLLLEPQK